MLNFHKKHSSFERRNALIADRLPEPNAWILDVGSNTGFTSRFLGTAGHYVLGVEKMPDEYHKAQKIAGGTAAFMQAGVDPAFFANSPQWSAILLLSVLHRIYAFEGADFMCETLQACGEKTDILFIEGSTRHGRYTDQGQPAPEFTEHDIASVSKWHEQLFAKALGADWRVESSHVLVHTKKEPYRILFHLSKAGR